MRVPANAGREDQNGGEDVPEGEEGARDGAKNLP